MHKTDKRKPLEEQIGSYANIAFICLGISILFFLFSGSHGGGWAINYSDVCYKYIILRRWLVFDLM